MSAFLAGHTPYTRILNTHNFLLGLPSLGDHHFCPQLQADLLYLLPVFLLLPLPCIPLAPVLALPISLCTVQPLLPLFLFGSAVAVFECPLHVWLPLSSLQSCEPIPPNFIFFGSQDFLRSCSGFSSPLPSPPLPSPSPSPSPPGLVPPPICQRSARPPARSTGATFPHFALGPWVA